MNDRKMIARLLTSRLLWLFVMLFILLVQTFAPVLVNAQLATVTGSSQAASHLTTEVERGRVLDASRAPTQKPILTRKPTRQRPSKSPTSKPTKSPTPIPTSKPSKVPTAFPTLRPTAKTFGKPTRSPRTSRPTQSPQSRSPPRPTISPSSSKPSRAPLSKAPTNLPTLKPTLETKPPTTLSPSRSPTVKPSSHPSTSLPSSSPTTAFPSQSPSSTPTTSHPSRAPITSKPSKTPTTSKPSSSPSSSPTVSSKPPTLPPTRSPTTSKPTISPTTRPTRPPRSGLLLQRTDPNFLYIADPNAIVVGDIIYVFCSRDPANAGPDTKYSQMRDYALITTNSMEEGASWVNHGVILKPSLAFPQSRVFQRKLMFAPTAAYKDGYFYIYFPYLRTQDGTSDVGVARSVNPTDPASWELMVSSMSGANLFDPAVMYDHRGQPYIYGNSRSPTDSPTQHRMLGAALNDDMYTLRADTVKAVPFFAGYVTEAVFAFWRQAPNSFGSMQITYYFLARVQNPPLSDCIMYWMSSGPLERIPASPGFRLTPNQYDAPPHVSVVQFKGRFYIFYHTGAENNGNKWRRSTCVDEVFFTQDGKMEVVNFTCKYQVRT